MLMVSKYIKFKILEQLYCTVFIKVVINRMELLSIIIVSVIVVVSFFVVKEQLIKNKNEKIINRRKEEKDKL